MAKEMNLSLARSRFGYRNMRVPLNIVVFEDATRLGFFDPHSYQVGINKRLMFLAKNDVIKNILRHELAHLITFLEHGRDVAAHGEEFKTVCRKYSFSDQVRMAKANVELENDMIEGDIPSEKLISRVKKLLSLATSDNEHESKLATTKANSLLLKHNLNNLKAVEAEEDVVCVKRVINGKKVTGKHRAIYEILKVFYVSPVFSYGQGSFYLEVIGSRTNVELADYVANFLDLELDNLWKSAQKSNKSLKGISKKNSFMNGVALGHVSKIKSVQTEIASSRELMLIDKDLKVQTKRVYARLGKSTSKSSTCRDSQELGKTKGRALQILSALRGKSKGPTKLLN
jgi:hypothetical protein